MYIIAAVSGIEPGIWKLKYIDEWDTDGWKNFTLIRPIQSRLGSERRTREYLFGWNGQRMSQTSQPPSPKHVRVAHAHDAYYR